MSYRQQQVRCVKIRAVEYAGLYEVPEITSGTHPLIWDVGNMWVRLTSWPTVVTEHHAVPVRTWAPIGVGHVSDHGTSVTLIPSIWVGATSGVAPAPAPASVAAFDGRWRHGCRFHWRHRVLARPLEEVADGTYERPKPTVVTVGSYNPRQYNNWTTQISQTYIHTQLFVHPAGFLSHFWDADFNLMAFCSTISGASFLLPLHK